MRCWDVSDSPSLCCTSVAQPHRLYVSNSTWILVLTGTHHGCLHDVCIRAQNLCYQSRCRPASRGPVMIQLTWGNHGMSL